RIWGNSGSNSPGTGEPSVPLLNSYPDDPDYGLHLSKALTAAGRAKEALSILDTLSKLPLATEDPRLAIARSGALAPAGDLKQAEAVAAAAAGKARQRGARLLLAQALLSEAKALVDLGEMDRAVAVASEAREIYSGVGNKFGIATALSEVGSARWY